MSTTQALAEIWPPLLAVAILLAALEIVLRKTVWLSSFESPLRNRLASIDGLRAILACGVVVCHIGTFFYLYRGMPWGPHPNPYFRQAGAASVRLFFMITGCLFWNKAISSCGKVNALRLYRNRFLRIMPLYGLLVAILALVALVASSFRFVEPPARVGLELGSLIVPGLRTVGSINGFDYTECLRQAWTLKWEIVFYALIPLLAFGARSWATFLGLAVGLVAVTAVGTHFFRFFPDLSITLNFLVGMFAAQLLCARPGWKFARTRLGSILVLATAIIAPLVIDRVSPYAGNLLYALLFICVLYGNDLFGLLTARSSRVLGEISYSVYLLHMLMLVPFYRLLNARMRINGLSQETFWLASTIPVTGIVLVSLLTFKYVESWGIARSHRGPKPST